MMDKFWSNVGHVRGDLFSRDVLEVEFMEGRGHGEVEKTNKLTKRDRRIFLKS